MVKFLEAALKGGTWPGISVGRLGPEQICLAVYDRTTDW